MTSPVIEARSIVKSFGGVRAVDDVSVSVMPGEIHAVIGENGAGKSTLMRLLLKTSCSALSPPTVVGPRPKR